MKPTLSQQAISDPKAVVAVYNNHSEAEAGVKELQTGGFDTKKLSIVGKDYHTEEQVVGYLLVAHGTDAEVTKAKGILKTTKPAEIHEHVLGKPEA